MYNACAASHAVCLRRTAVSSAGAIPLPSPAPMSVKLRRTPMTRSRHGGTLRTREASTDRAALLDRTITYSGSFSPTDTTPTHSPHYLLHLHRRFNSFQNCVITRPRSHGRICLFYFLISFLFQQERTGNKDTPNTKKTADRKTGRQLQCDARGRGRECKLACKPIFPFIAHEKARAIGRSLWGSKIGRGNLVTDAATVP